MRKTTKIMLTRASVMTIMCVLHNVRYCHGSTDLLSPLIISDASIQFNEDASDDPIPQLSIMETFNDSFFASGIIDTSESLNSEVILLVSCSNVTGILKRKKKDEQIAPPKRVRFITYNRQQGDNTNEENVDQDVIDTKDSAGVSSMIYGVVIVTISVAAIVAMFTSYYFIRRQSRVTSKRESLDTTI
eukprot:455091_1